MKHLWSTASASNDFQRLSLKQKLEQFLRLRKMLAIIVDDNSCDSRETRRKTSFCPRVGTFTKMWVSKTKYLKISVITNSKLLW